MSWDGSLDLWSQQSFPFANLRIDLGRLRGFRDQVTITLPLLGGSGACDFFFLVSKAKLRTTCHDEIVGDH